jgi:hypothetical protein
VARLFRGRHRGPRAGPGRPRPISSRT